MSTTTTFITEDFLLGTKTASELYHTYAEQMPIIDYHCHLSPKEVAENKRFDNITQGWLAGDHYKWRAMRTCGVDERLITGDATDYEKFKAWAATVPKVLRNPLYHWTHLELNRPFGIADRVLNSETADGIWETTRELLAKPEFTTQGILKQMCVEIVCTTDDPVDSLEYHDQYRQSGGNGCTRMIPAFRPDKAMAVEDVNAFLSWVQQLAQAADTEINSYAAFLEAIARRHQYFHNHGCRLSDHGLETAYAESYTDSEIAVIFTKLLAGQALTPGEILKFKSAMLYELGVMDHERGWVQQFHLGALRNNNSRMMRKIGPDTGFDTIGDFEIARPLAKLMDRLDTDDRLAKTILYNLNPRDNELMAAMIGNFQDGSVAGKIQYGAAWWFLDQKDGMTKQLEALSNMGVLSQFVGMLTDSRSFLSYPRHEYFRRILCNILGSEMEEGLLPNDIELVGGMVKEISYFNAKRYFQF
ncbi:MAG TPA: glucuronate isomerase [Bacteroidota bacterium]|nr:glucuronate isomerase [Bacteroidota bacterium]